MSENLPDGWTCVGGDHWRHINEATADMHRPHGLWRAAVYGSDRQSKAEADTDRLNMIAGLEGRSSAALTTSCIDNARALRVERDAALAKVAQLETRRAGDRAEHKALTVERDAALAKVATLTAEVKTLTEAREYLERNIGELEDRRDADEAHVADLELELSEARLGHDAAEKRLEESERSMRRALTKVMMRPTPELLSRLSPWARGVFNLFRAVE